MPGVDFWLDWSVGATVGQLRRLLPCLVADAGYRLREVESMMTHGGWAQLALEADAFPRPFGTVRAQDAGDGRSQVIVAPGPARDPAALLALNRAALALYCGLVARGLLAPPPPLEAPADPLLPTEA
ncbi:MAG TPA: hypothetical protein VG370_28555 [Chloroflexota bacterium]|nr:hypothetical protein [Chloroflexota bacterium]